MSIMIEIESICRVFRGRGNSRPGVGRKCFPDTEGLAMDVGRCFAIKES